MNRAVLGLYCPGDSLLHRLPARVKLTALLLAAAGTVWLDGPVRIAAALLVTLALYAVAGVPRPVLYGQLRPLIALSLALGVFQLVAHDWRTALTVVGVLVLLVLQAALVTLTTRASEMVDTVVGLCRPMRVVGIDPERIGLLLALGMRSVPVVIGLAQEVREAQLARGQHNRPTAIAIPLILRALGHADQLAEALVARGLDD